MKEQDLTFTANGREYRYRKPTLGRMAEARRFAGETDLDRKLDLVVTTTDDTRETEDLWMRFLGIIVENADDGLALMCLTPKEVQTITQGFIVAAGLILPKPVA